MPGGCSGDRERVLHRQRGSFPEHCGHIPVEKTPQEAQRAESCHCHEGQHACRRGGRWVKRDKAGLKQGGGMMAEGRKDGPRQHRRKSRVETSPQVLGNA